MKKIIFIGCLLGLFTASFAQFTTIPDKNFREALETAQPYLFTTDHKLIDSLAAKHNTFLNCTGRGIVSISGIEKFQSLRFLDLSNNLIVDVSGIASLKALEDLNLQNNAIVQIPSLADLTQLSYLFCSNNRIKSLPDLSQNVKLKKLQCFNNEIPEILGLDKLVILEFLIAYDNKIQRLPDLSNLQQLSLLECHGNQIDTLIGIGNLKNLKTLITGANFLKTTGNLKGLSSLTMLSYWRNQIAQTPDLSELPMLEEFDFNANKLQTLPNFLLNPNLKRIKCQDNELNGTIGLQNLKALEHLQLSNNKIKNWPKLQGTEGTLNELYLNNNLLDSIPDLSSYKTLDTLSLQNNQLTFEDLEPLMSLNIQKLLYNPQKDIVVTDLMKFKSGDAFEWTIDMDHKSQYNTYTWYKDGVVVATTNKGTLRIPVLQTSDAGQYLCQITNSIVGNLILKTTPMKLIVWSCIDLSAFKYTSTEISCTKSGSLSIDETSITSDNRNFSYELKTSAGVAIPASNLSYENLVEMTYTLTVSNGQGCRASLPIQIPTSLEDCGKGIILATGEDPALQSFYIEGQGAVKIYNKSGLLVKKLTAPTYWDGKLDDGQILPGLYIIEINSKFIEVTIMK